MTDDERQDSPEEEAAEQETPAPETPEAEAPAEAGDAEEAAEAQEPVAEVPAEDEPAQEESPAEEPAAEEPAAEEPAAEEPVAEAERPSRKERNPKKSDEAEAAIPGAHLEPDLVLDEPAEADPYAVDGDEAEGGDQPAEDAAPEPISTTILELAADARYLATGKRKSAVARVTIKPGTGTYTVNNKELDVFFPRPTLQRVVRGPLETVGQQERLDVVAKIHGGGVSSQAGALRHGIARALVEADPNLRGELKRRGFLTRDPRVKERKKAGLKKARKRPQFSKR